MISANDSDGRAPLEFDRPVVIVVVTGFSHQCGEMSMETSGNRILREYCATKKVSEDIFAHINPCLRVLVLLLTPE